MTWHRRTSTSPLADGLGQLPPRALLLFILEEIPDLSSLQDTALVPAFMLNAELAIYVTQQQERMSFMLTGNRLRGHTYKFNTEQREQSLVKILAPTNMGMHFSQDGDINRIWILD